MTKVRSYCLYRVTTTIAELAGCRDVAINWVMASERNGPLVPYANVISGYDPLDGLRYYAESAVDEKFTRDEAHRLIAWLVERRSGTHQMTEAVFPIRKDYFPSSAMPTGGPVQCICLHHEPDWTLPFRVNGHFDLRDYEPLPSREADLERRRWLVSNQFTVRDGKVVFASDLEKIDPLH